MVGLTLAEIEEEAARRIVALDSSRFHFDLPGEQGWRESREPLTAVESTVGNSHLSFSCSVEDAPVLEESDSGDQLAYITVQATLVVAFLYKLPATDRLAAMRLATEAARTIVAALLAPWPEVNVWLRQRYRPGPVRDDGFMPVELRFMVQTDEPL